MIVSIWLQLELFDLDVVLCFLLFFFFFGKLIAILTKINNLANRGFCTRCDLYEIETVLEKPTPTEAEQQLLVPGLRAGHYLCLFGMHVLTPAVMEILGQLVAASPDKPVGLVYVAVARQGKRTLVRECRFGNSGRSEIRLASVKEAIALTRTALT